MLVFSFLVTSAVLVVFGAYWQAFFPQVEPRSMVIAQLGHLARLHTHEEVFHGRRALEFIGKKMRTRALRRHPELFNRSCMNTTDFWVDVEETQKIRVRKYFFDQSAATEPSGQIYFLPPVLLWFHGGGWTRGNLETDDTLCRQLAKELKFPVISVEYRLAPEHPFPVPWMDAYRAFLWVRENSERLGIDSYRIIVGGESAGGNLAAAVLSYHLSTLTWQSVNPFEGALFIYPPLAPISTSRNFSFNGWLTFERMEWLREIYSNGSTEARGNYLFSPLLTPPDVLAKYPANTVVVVAGQDVVTEENKEFVRRLHSVGVHAQLHEYNSTIHGFFGRSMFSRFGAEALQAAIQAFVP